MGEACNIEDYKEYKGVVKSILKTKPSKPISLIIELVQIQKHSKVNYIAFSPYEYSSIIMI